MAAQDGNSRFTDHSGIQCLDFQNDIKIRSGFSNHLVGSEEILRDGLFFNELNQRLDTAVRGGVKAFSIGQNTGVTTGFQFVFGGG